MIRSGQPSQSLQGNKLHSNTYLPMAAVDLNNMINLRAIKKINKMSNEMIFSGRI